MMLEDPYVEAALQAPPSPDYVSGPEYPPSPEFVLEPVYSKFMLPEDEDPREDPLINLRRRSTMTHRSMMYSSDDNEDDDDDFEEDEDEEEEEEHPAPADSVPPPVHCVTARMSILEQPPIPFWASVAMMRAAAPSTYILASQSETPPLLLILLPTPSPPLPLPSTDHRTDRLEVGKSSSAPTARPFGGFRADYRFVAALDDEIRRDPERYVGYGVTDTWDDMVEDIQDTYEIYVRLDDAQDDRLLMSGRLNKLHRDRHAHARTALLMEREARLSREAWGRSMDANDNARFEVRALRTTVLAQQIEIAAL
ncbi:hypothetical protein Tco_1392594 [Tanacetum coccineum]